MCVVAPTNAQTGDGSALLAEIRLEGDQLPSLTVEALQEQLRTRANRRFLGVPGITPALWLYQLGGEGDQPLGRALQRAGEAPAVYDPAVATADAARLAALFRQEGFLAAQVAVRVDTLDSGPPLRVRVTFDVAAGPPTFLRHVRYEGLDALTAGERRVMTDGTVLELRLAGGDASRFTAEGSRFSERLLLAERRRLLDFLRARGFARVGRDSVQAIVFGLPGGAPDTMLIENPPDSVDVTVRVRTGPRFRFGDVLFVVSGPEARTAPRTDTLSAGDGHLAIRMDGESQLSSGLLRRALRFRPGDPYDATALLATKRRLERTGVFTFSEIVALPPDTAEVGLPRLPHRIGLRTRRRHAVRLEGFVLQRTGVLGTEAEELALGTGATYRNANTFGRGEALTLRATGSVAGDLADGFPTAQAEIGAGLTVPGLVWPFGAVERALSPFDARTRFSLGFLTARRAALGIVLRGRAALGLRFEVQHTRTLISFLDLLDLSLSDPDTLAGFSERFLSFVEDPVARQFILEDYTRPQINNALRYTLRAGTADLFRRDRGSLLEASLEVGGNLPELLDRLVFTPDTVEGSLPGLPLFGGDASNRLEYRPYVRAQVDARRYYPQRRTVLAVKLFAGAAHPTGDSPVVPFDRRFFSGGATSVRGWRLRSLGPGAVDDEAAFVQGGDVKLEAAAEARYIALRRVLSADWQLALFADAGNVWFGPRTPGDSDGRFRIGSFYRQLAVSSGAGLRIAWDYLILRFDLAWQVHAPVPGRPLFPEGLGRPLFHFGIGQAL